VAVEQGSDQPGGDAYVYALRDKAGYLQTDEDEKPAIIAEPLPDPASIVCSFCGKSAQQVSEIFAGQRPVRDPYTLAIAGVGICNECVAKFAELLAKSGRSRSGSR
jgi:hypothetical protein